MTSRHLPRFKQLIDVLARQPSMVLCASSFDSTQQEITPRVDLCSPAAQNADSHSPLRGHHASVPDIVDKNHAIEVDAHANIPVARAVAKATALRAHSAFGSASTKEDSAMATHIPQRAPTVLHPLPSLHYWGRHRQSISQIKHIEISRTYERADGVTMYVVDVYMHHENTATVGDAAAASTKPDYQRECRFSEFCVLRQRLIETIAQPPLREGTSRRGWCLHCYRLDTLVVCGSFPTRYVAPQLMRVTMIKGMVIKHRQAVITDFLQRLVQSFTGNGPAHRGNICTRFLDSSSIFKDFVFG